MWLNLCKKVVNDTQGRIWARVRHIPKNDYSCVSRAKMKQTESTGKYLKSNDCYCHMHCGRRIARGIKKGMIVIEHVGFAVSNFAFLNHELYTGGVTTRTKRPNELILFLVNQ